MLDANDLVSQGLLADVLRRQSKLAEAVELFHKVLEVMPGDVESSIGLSKALQEGGKLAEAIGVLREAVRLAPANARLRTEISRLYHASGDRESASREAGKYRELRRR